MKSLLLILLLSVLGTLLLADNTEQNNSNLTQVAAMGSFEVKDGNKYFVNNTGYLSVRESNNFLLDVCQVFLGVQKDWISYTSTDFTDGIKGTMYITVKLQIADVNYTASVYMDDLKAGIDESTFNGSDKNALIGSLNCIIEDHSILEEVE